MKKTALLLISLLLVVASLTSCGGSYRDDVKISDLTNTAVACVDFKDGTTAEDADFYDYYFKSPDYVDSYCITKSDSSISVDEIGIFHLTGNVKAFEKTCRDYLALRLERYNGAAANYKPEEYPKYKNAEVKVFGNYVVYCILSDADRAEVFSAVETALNK